MPSNIVQGQIQSKSSSGGSGGGGRGLYPDPHIKNNIFCTNFKIQQWFSPGHGEGWSVDPSSTPPDPSVQCACTGSLPLLGFETIERIHFKLVQCNLPNSLICRKSGKEEAVYILSQ